MTDTTEAPPATRDVSGTKWWGQSVTIWGVIITTLSTVLPAFGPLIGLDITAELIRQLGDQIVVIAQAGRPHRHNSDDLGPRPCHNFPRTQAANHELVKSAPSPAPLAEPPRRLV